MTDIPVGTLTRPIQTVAQAHLVLAQEREDSGAAAFVVAFLNPAFDFRVGCDICLLFPRSILARG